MMKFNCDICKYSTDVKFAYQKHMNSKRHGHKVTNSTKNTSNESYSVPNKIINRTSKKDYKCLFCNGIYATASNLARHEKACSKRNNLQTQYLTEIEKKDLEIKHLKELHSKDAEMINQLKDENTTVKNDISYLKTLINNAGAVIKTSVSALAYVTKNYTDAPKLQKLEDYTYLEYNDNNDEFDLVSTVISHHQSGLLCQYLSDIIINVYKTDDPSEQSIWNSDSVRLTYLIRDIINKKTDWTVDKKGIKTSKYIIKPLLDYIRELLNKYSYENRLEQFCHEPYMKFKKRTDDMNAVAEIIATIKNNILSEQILKYIAPHFYLTKNDNDELIDV